MKKIFTIASLFLIILHSCTNASEDDLTNSQPPPSLVTYNADVKNIIANNCIRCHSDPPINDAPIPLVTYSNVKSAVQNNNLISKINGNGPGALMPFGGPKLPQSLIDLITKWESDGLLEN